jgi:hypothetical protein
MRPEVVRGRLASGECVVLSVPALNGYLSLLASERFAAGIVEVRAVYADPQHGLVFIEHTAPSPETLVKSGFPSRVATVLAHTWKTLTPPSVDEGQTAEPV